MSPLHPQKKRRWPWLLLLLLLLLSAGIPTTAAWMLTTPARVFSMQQAPRVAYEKVMLPARTDGVQVAGWYVPHPSAQRALVLVHGKDESRSETFQGHFAELASALQQKGFAVLMIDLRGHGESAAAHLSFGVYEQRDVLGAVDWLKAKHFADKRIGVLGVSMGGAASLFATAQEPAIGALVTDGAFADLYPVVMAEWPTVSHLPSWMLPPTNWAVRLLFGYNLQTVRPLDAMRSLATRPVMVIHGDADRLIPVKQAYAFQEANPAVALWIAQGAGHTQVYGRDPIGYVQKVSTFFSTYLGD